MVKGAATVSTNGESGMTTGRHQPVGHGLLLVVVGSTEGWVIWVLRFYFGEAINPIYVEYYLLGKIFRAT